MNFVERRISICRSCPESSEIGLGLLQCQQCQCIIQTKALVPWAQCPRKLWNIELTDAENDDVLINDYYISLSMPDSAYKQQLQKLWKVRFADANPEVLFRNLVERRSQKPQDRP